MQRSFLFLQSVCSPFFSRLAKRLLADNHQVIKVNFNAGDAAYWQMGKSPRCITYLYRASLAELPEFIDSLRQKHAITDQVVFGDCRPVHRYAIESGQRDGLRTHVFEEGYFRPYWVTLEREGVNGHSLLPKDPEWFHEAARLLPPLPSPVSFKTPFKVRAFHDVLYHAAGLANPIVAPHYRNHAPITAPREYVGYAKRFSLMRYWKKRDARRVAQLIKRQVPYFILPLQLNTDSQIHQHSSFRNMQHLCQDVMASFASFAPANAHLVIKNHPLDMSLQSHWKEIKRLAQQHGILDRVHYLEAGDLNHLVRYALGTVTVNSTSGVVALEHRCPTFALGDPVYNIAGLTQQGDLAEFWQNPTPPSDTLFQAFKQTLLSTVQINGSFYCQKGIALAVENAVDVMAPEHSRLEKLL
nr:capsular biosynthesis protein [uncultured Halomonas sp.]